MISILTSLVFGAAGGFVASVALAIYLDKQQGKNDDKI